MRDFKIYFSAACLVLALYVVIQYNKPKPIDWKPTLSCDDKIPFGTYLLYNRFTDIVPGAQVNQTNGSIYRQFSQKMQAGSYVIIAKNANLSKNDFTQLLKFIKAGNTVFIAAFGWSDYLQTMLGIDADKDDKKENTSLNFVNPALKQATDFRFNNDISNQYFTSFDTTLATVISKNHAGNATLLSYSFAKGKLLVCANPLLFTNYSLLTPQGAAYAERALSYLPTTKIVYWDRYQNHDLDEDRSPMRVFLNNPSLQWAYYLSLFTLLVYVLFQVKRRQRAIPVVAPLKNSTLDFVNVVGRVYYEKRDNTDIAYKKIVYLLSHLREKYQLKTGKLDAEFIDTLAQKTGISQADATELINQVNYLTQVDNINDKDLILLNQLIEKFYSQS